MNDPHNIPPLWCTRAADVPSGAVVPPGVGPLACSGCGCRLLAAPSSREMARAGRVRPVCSACLAATGKTYLPVMTRGQAEELARLGREDARRDAERN